MSCTTPDCGRATEMFLCTTCILELDKLIKDVPFFFEQLDPVHQATKVVRGPGNEGGNGTHKAGSKPPTNLDCGQLRQNLAMLPKRAYTVATQDPEAGRTLVMARAWINSAETLVHGPKPATPDHEAKTKLQAETPKEPMRVKQLVEWLKTAHNIDIQPGTIRRWASRDLITRTNPGEWGPTYDPTQILVITNTRKTSPQETKVV